MHEAVIFYQEPGIVLYHADCRDVLPAITGDVTITDPPYNVGKAYGAYRDTQHPLTYRQWLRSILGQCPGRSVIFFPGLVNTFDVKDLLAGTDLRPYQMLGWHRKEFAGDLWTSGPAICWEPIVWAIRSEKPSFQRLYSTYGRNFLVVNSTHGNPYRLRHPCPKPIAVMRWLIQLFTAPGEMIVDPFCGSGTTLAAAKELGRRAIGMEIEYDFCQLTVERLQQTMPLFDQPCLIQEAMTFDTYKARS
jgi:hypothetical protein